MWKILMFEIYPPKMVYVNVILGSECEKLRIWQHTFHAILALSITVLFTD